jgi:hypothetical protein
MFSEILKLNIFLDYLIISTLSKHITESSQDSITGKVERPLKCALLTPKQERVSAGRCLKYVQL